MDRKVVLAFLAGLGTAALINRVSRAPDPPPDPADGIHAARRASSDPAHRAVARSAAPDPDPEPEPDAVSTFEQVVRKIAEYSGEGVVRCDAGTDLPDGPVNGIGRAWVEDGVLVGSVGEPSGQARIQLAEDPLSAPPRVVIRWSGAWPGETGACSVAAPKRVAVSGRVVDRQGRPVRQGEVGNLIDGAQPIGDDGQFAVLCWQGAACPLAARRGGGAPFGPFLTVVPDKVTTGLVVVLDDTPPDDLETYLVQRVAEDERLERLPDPLMLALADPELPTESRPVVERWLAEEREGRSVARALLAEVASR
ncbi:MAG: hypothetical protein ABMA64_27455 [Myxococcota bacterium]